MKKILVSTCYCTCYHSGISGILHDDDLDVGGGWMCLLVPRSPRLQDLDGKTRQKPRAPQGPLTGRSFKVVHEGYHLSVLMIIDVPMFNRIVLMMIIDDH